MFERMRNLGQRVGIIKPKVELMPAFYAYVHRGALKIGQLLRIMDLKDVPEFIRMTEGLKKMIEEGDLDRGALFRAQQLINLVDNENLEAEIRKAKGERVVGNTNN